MHLKTCRPSQKTWAAFSFRPSPNTPYARHTCKKHLRPLQMPLLWLFSHNETLTLNIWWFTVNWSFLSKFLYHFFVLTFYESTINKVVLYLLSLVFKTKARGDPGFVIIICGMQHASRVFSSIRLNIYL